MIEWEHLELGEILTIKYGKDHKRLGEGHIPCFGSGGIMRFVDAQLSTKPSVLIPRKGSLNNIFFVDRPFWTVDTLFWTQIDEERAHPKFTYYKALTIDWESMNVGSAVPSLTSAIISGVQISLPSLIEQEAIAEVLGSLDDKIDLLKRQNKTLEGMAEALFRQWFIEEAQDDWPVVELRDVFEEIESGRRPKGGVGKYTEGVPSIGAESVKKIGVHEFGKEKFVPQEFFDSMKKGVVKHHDILVYKDGGVPGEFKPHFTMVGFGFPHAKMCINEHVFRCRPKRPSLRSFSFCFLNSRRCRFELEERGTGAAIPGLNSTEFSTSPIPLPNEELLEKFESLAGDWFDRILKNALESRALEKLRDTLLPKLMSGEVRVQMD